MAYHSKRLLISQFAAILLAFCSACGYNFNIKGEPIGVTVDSLAIPLFESTSTDRGFEAEFTEIIRNEFISRSSMPIVEREQAGAVISGRIYEIETQPLSYNTVKQTVEGNTVSYETDGTRKLIIKIDITMTDRATGKIIWHEDSMREEAVFRVSEDPLKNRYNKDQAIRNIAGLMAKKIYLNSMERF
jgi:hypothetical protein